MKAFIKRFRIAMAVLRGRSGVSVFIATKGNDVFGNKTIDLHLAHTTMNVGEMMATHQTALEAVLQSKSVRGIAQRFADSGDLRPYLTSVAPLMKEPVTKRENIN